VLIISSINVQSCSVPYIRHSNFLKQFGTNLKKIRKEKGLSQEYIAFNSELSVNQIGRIERGEINTSLSTVYEIAQTINVDIKELFDF